jgi:hypothetical protein
MVMGMVDARNYTANRLHVMHATGMTYPKQFRRKLGKLRGAFKQPSTTSCGNRP